jgi:hypothetical protein
VCILTRKSIPVHFYDGTDKSCTDGEQIIIGTELSKGEFDATVGVALHEASHCVKSDFDLKKTIWGRVPGTAVNKAKAAGIEHARFAKFAGDMLNWVEDRFIDAWTYNEAPGYQGYYDAMYNKYWHSEKVSIGVASMAYRAQVLPCYEFRVINLTNAHSDLDALPGLRDILEVVDLDCILRLEKPSDRLAVAMQVVSIVADNLLPVDEASKEKKRKGKPDVSPAKNKTSENSTESDEGESGEGDETEGNDSKSNSKPDDNSKEEGDDPAAGGKTKDDTQEEDFLGGENSEADKASDPGDFASSQEDKEDELCKSDKKGEEDAHEDIKSTLEKQKNFLEGKFQKGKLSKEDSSILQHIEDSETEIELSIPETIDDVTISSCECVVIHNLTPELLDSNTTPFKGHFDTLIPSDTRNDAIARGIRLGQALSRKLKMRGETKVLKTSRRDKGKIDGRLINELGHGNEKVFFHVDEDKYDNIHLHISIDSSGSMQYGPKWAETITSVIAICKAAAMIPNIEVVVSLRTGTNLPYVAIAYDSRRDKFTKIQSVFSRVLPNGSTPEGLTFHAIAKMLPPVTPDRRVFFLNFSDGIPEFANILKNELYMGESAAKHTAKQVRKMAHMGVEIMSYFINTPGAVVKIEEVKNLFTIMYGKAGIMINPTDMVEVAKEMNQRFLKKT